MKKHPTSQSSLLKSTLVMSVATFLSRILGLIREQAIAYYFGASGLTDTFNVAYRIPNLLRDLLAEGAFSSAFVPTFTQYLHRQKKEAVELFNSCFWFLLALTSLFTIIFLVFAPQLILLFAPEYSQNPEKLELTVGLLRVMAPFLTFVSLAAIIMGVLNSVKLFFVPALAPAAFNVGSILFIFFFTPWLQAQGYLSIYALAWGVLAGGVLQLVVQIPLLMRQGFTLSRPKELLSPGVIKILRKLAPGLVGYAASQVNILINTILATSTVVGAVSWLNYAFRLFSFPLGILSVALGNSTLVHFSEKWKQGDKSAAVHLLSRSYFYSWILMSVPFLIIFHFSDWIVNLVYQRGQFDAQDTLETARSLFWYGIGLPFYGLFKLLMPIFYSIDRSRIPMYTSIVSLSVNICYSLVLIGKYGHPVLAQATSISVGTNVLLLCFFLHKYLEISYSFFFSTKIFKVFVAVFCCSILCIFLRNLIPFYQYRFVLKGIALAVIATINYVAFDLLLFFMKEETLFFRRILQKSKAKFFK